MKNEAERDKKEAAEQEKLFQLERFRKQAEQMESFHRAEVGSRRKISLKMFSYFRWAGSKRRLKGKGKEQGKWTGHGGDTLFESQPYIHAYIYVCVSWLQSRSMCLTQTLE